MKDLSQNITEGVLGAAKDGGVKVFILKVFIFPSPFASSEPTPNTRVPLRLSLGET